MRNFLIILFAALSFSAAAYNEELLLPLEPSSSIDAGTLLSADAFKKLAKKHKAESIRCEIWADGRTYYVLTDKKGRSGLLDENFEPLIFTDYTGKRFKYMYHIGQTGYNGKYYYLACEYDEQTPAMFDSDFVQQTPPGLQSEHPIFKGITLNGRDYIYQYDDSEVFTLYIMKDYKYWVRGKNFTPYPAKPEGYSEFSPGMVLWSPAHEDYFACNSLNEGHNGESCVFYHDSTKSIPESHYPPKTYVLPGGGYLIYSPDSPIITTREVVRDLGNGYSSDFTEIVVTTENPKKANFNAFRPYVPGKPVEFIGKAVNRLVISAPDQVAFSEKYYPELECFRRGAVDLTDLSNSVPPLYNNVFFYDDADGRSTPWVRTVAFSPLRRADSVNATAPCMPEGEIELHYERSASETDMYGLENCVLTAPFIKSSNLIRKELQGGKTTETHILMFLTGETYFAQWTLADLRRMINNYYQMQDARNHHADSKKLDFDADGRPTAKDLFRKYIKASSELIGMLIDQGTFSDTIFAQATLASLEETLGRIEYMSEHNLREAYDAFAQQMEAQRREQERLRAEQLAREREEAQQRLAFAILAALDRTSQNIVNAVSRPKPKTRISASAGRSSAGSGSSSSGGESSADRKAFLKREIIEWENKVRKAKDSYEQAAENWSSNGSWESKRAMESKKATYDDFQSQLDAYKAELSSLR